MRGYWHVPAIAVTSAMISIILDQAWLIFIFFIWLVFLYWRKRLKMIVLCISVALLFVTALQFPHILSPEDLSDASQTPLSGTIKSDITRTEDKIEFIMSTHSNVLLNVVYFHDDIALEIPELGEDLHHGAKCELNQAPEKPSTATNPGEFDFRSYLATKQIYHQVTLNSLDDITCSGKSRLDIIYELRSKLKTHVDLSLDPETAGWLKALVFGDDTGIDNDTIELFRRWSLSHLLAISGLHVGLIIALLYMVLIKGNMITKSKAQWIMLLFLPLYALLAGGEPSVWRAGFMAMLLIIMNKIGSQASLTDGLSVIFIIIILLDPFIVYHIGFQFSFVVTLGLLLSKQWLRETEHVPFVSLLKISFISQMMILPLTINYFYFFNPLSILLNVLIVPYFTLFVIPFMFVILASTVLPVLPHVFDSLFFSVHQLALALVGWVDHMIYYPMILAELPVWAIGLYYAVFVWLMIGLQENKKIEAFRRGLSLVFILVMLMLRPYFSPIGTVTTLDIGQGDAAVIELPYRKGVIMIDAGGTFSFRDKEATDKTYKQIIEPFLLSRGIGKVNALFLSHADLDHIGSADDIIQNFNVDTLLLSDYYEADPESQQLWEASNTDVHRVGSPSRVTIGGHHFSILSPDRDWGSPNENSLVVFSTFGKKDWLFMGDAGEQVERHILNHFSNVEADVLKVGHHGSKTSTSRGFVASIQPDHGLISVGRNNRYGHPAADVLETLKTSHVEILRTDTSGAIVFEFKQDEGTFFKYKAEMD